MFVDAIANVFVALSPINVLVFSKVNKNYQHFGFVPGINKYKQ
jgi:hypothetical protein